MVEILGAAFVIILLFFDLQEFLQHHFLIWNGSFRLEEMQCIYLTLLNL